MRQDDIKRRYYGGLEKFLWLIATLFILKMENGGLWVRRIKGFNLLLLGK